MLLRDIMTRELVTVHETDSLAEAARLIIEHRIAGLPVLDARDRLVGIISEKDILREMHPHFYQLLESPSPALNSAALEADFKDIASIRVADAMAIRPRTAPPTMPLIEAASIMTVYNIRRLPVIEGARLVGLVSQGDVYQALFREHLRS